MFSHKLLVILGLGGLAAILFVSAYAVRTQRLDTFSKAAAPPKIFPTPQMTPATTIYPTPYITIAPTPIAATAWYIEFNCGGNESYILSSSQGCRDVAIWKKEADLFCQTAQGKQLASYTLGSCLLKPPPPSPWPTPWPTPRPTIIIVTPTPTPLPTPKPTYIVPTPTPATGAAGYRYIKYTCIDESTYTAGSDRICASQSDAVTYANADCRTKLGGSCPNNRCLLWYSFSSPCTP